MRSYAIALGIPMFITCLVVGFWGLASIPAKEAQPVQSVAPAAPAAEISAGHKLAYDAARSRAIDQLAKEKKITRRAARAAIEKVTDAQIHQAVTAAGLTVGDAPAPGFLDKLVTWFEDHKDVIEAIIKLFLMLAPLLGA